MIGKKHVLSVVNDSTFKKHVFTANFAKDTSKILHFKPQKTSSELGSKHVIVKVPKKAYNLQDHNFSFLGNKSTQKKLVPDPSFTSTGIKTNKSEPNTLSNTHFVFFLST